MQLQSKHDSATSFVDAGNAYKKADPQGKAAESGSGIRQRNPGLFPVVNAQWWRRWIPAFPGDLGWCRRVSTIPGVCWDWGCCRALGISAASILVWLGSGEGLPEEWLQAVPGLDPGGIPAVSSRLSPALAFAGMRIEDLGFFQAGCDFWESLQSHFP